VPGVVAGTLAEASESFLLAAVSVAFDVMSAKFENVSSVGWWWCWLP
jgi:hypothetical protein